ncbi:MAG: TIGR03905 family TSCPD domain-containing protein [Muribaculaceae bacterium]|nr:TIGR03905 family TSCPD domain-containing protein [Muribaculaceae bacterium]
MTIEYKPAGVCSRLIKIDIDDNDVITGVTFDGGCAGNTQGVAALARGRKVDEVVAALRGIDCRGRGTSCPDQLAAALATALANR